MFLRKLLVIGSAFILLAGCGQAAPDGAQSAAQSVQGVQAPTAFLDSLSLSDSVTVEDAEGRTLVFGTLDDASMQQVEDYWAAVLAANDSAEARDATISSTLEIDLEDQTVSMTIISDLPEYLEAHGIPDDGLSLQNFVYCIEKT
ncbi:MAG: hypothetical protein Q3Y08_08060 [Butyricicoccus sp.]|nr:hypothetical protein [Butyricicoccus sp.]